MQLWLSHRNNITLSLAMAVVSNNKIRVLSSIYNRDPKKKDLSTDKLLHLLLYGSKLNNFEINREIIELIVKLLKLFKRFERSIPWPV